MNLVAMWAQAVVGYLLDGELVWKIHRVRTADLARVGLSHLEGTEAYREIRAEVAAERERQLLALGRAPDAAEAAAKEADEARLVRTLRNLERLESTPEGRSALLERADAYICAAVSGAALLQEPVARPTISRDCPAIVTIDPATGETIPDGGWHPWKWSTTEERLELHIAALQRRTEAERHVWAQLIQLLLHGEARRAVEPFRAGPGGAAAAARPGADVPHGPVDGGALDPRADRGEHGGVRGGGGAEGSGAA